MGTPKILDELEWRGLVAQSTDRDALAAELDSGPITVYSGFDPTAPSLHAGHLIPLLTLRRFQQAGHRPIVLAGGATGMIGDPRDIGERTLNTADTVADWADRIRGQLERFVDFDDLPTGAVVQNNLSWTSELSAIEFLRDVGKHFSVNVMLDRDTVRRRLDGEGISYTEFSYMLLQANDYVELHRRYGCALQVGGSDQWGNIIAGVRLVRQKAGASVHALTVPRGGTEVGYPVDRKVYASWNKPIVVMCNQNSFSNAEIFSHAIKTLKRGHIVGTTTAGGVISTGGTSIMDVGFLRLPFRGWYLVGDGQDMELNGCKPDVELWPLPGEMPAGSLIVLQIHYNLLATDGKAGETDQSSVRLRLTDGTPATKPLETLPLQAPTELPCASGQAGPLCDRAAALANLTDRFGHGVGNTEAHLVDQCSNGTPVPGNTQHCDIPVPQTLTVYAALGHMHLLGRSIKIEVDPGTAKAQTLLDVPSFNFDDQRLQPLPVPAHLKPGDIVRVTCTHDASLRRQLPQLRKLPPRYVVWGDGTSDEMCLGLLITTIGD